MEVFHFWFRAILMILHKTGNKWVHSYGFDESANGDDHFGSRCSKIFSFDFFPWNSPDMAL